MSESKCVLLGHGAANSKSTLGIIKTSLSLVGARIDPHIFNGVGGNQLKRNRADRIVRSGNALIVELSDYSTGNGRACACEQYMLEVAAHSGIPCVLIINEPWHFEQTRFLTNPYIITAIKLVVLHDLIGEQEFVIASRFPEAKVDRLSRRATDEIAGWIKRLADVHAASFSTEAA